MEVSYMFLKSELPKPPMGVTSLLQGTLIERGRYSRERAAYNDGKLHPDLEFVVNSTA